MAALWLLLLVLSLDCMGAGGFVAHVESTCVLDDAGTPQDFTYCVSFNKDLLACWDPDVGKIVPCEFGVLSRLAEIISNILNEQESLIHRLQNGLQDCATHTQPFWDVLTHRTSEQRGSLGAQPGGQRTRRCVSNKGVDTWAGRDSVDLEEAAGHGGSSVVMGSDWRKRM